MVIIKLYNLMFIGAIVALDNKNGIGNDNKLPWKLKGDLKRFKEITVGNGNNCIVMSKNTFNSIKFLKNRDNLVLSTSLIIDKKQDNNLIKSFDNINELMIFLKNKNYKKIWIIGGGIIYKQFIELNLINSMIITVINDVYQCDVFFPEIPNNFIKINERILNEKTELGKDTKICIYKKLEVGMSVYYKNDNNTLWKIIKVHTDDYPDYYFTIKNEFDREIQTIREKLKIVNN
jgi:dihydrofolate reductase